MPETGLEPARGLNPRAWFRDHGEAEVQAWLRQILRNNLGKLKRRYCGTGKRQMARELPPLGGSGDPLLGVQAAVLATAGVDARIHLWDVADWSEQRQLWGHAGIVRSVAFSPDGALLASASTDQVINLWDVGEGRLVRSWKEADSALSVAWSPDGRTVATCSDDRTVKLWEATTGQELARLGPRASKDLSLCFGPRGGWLAAAGYDKDVYVWDAASHTLLASAEARGTVRDLARTPDGRLLATAEGFGSLSLWHLAGRKARRTHCPPRRASAFPWPQAMPLGHGSPRQTVGWFRQSVFVFRRPRAHFLFDAAAEISDPLLGLVGIVLDFVLIHRQGDVDLIVRSVTRQPKPSLVETHGNDASYD